MNKLGVMRTDSVPPCTMVHATFQRAHSDPNQERWRCPDEEFDTTNSGYPASGTLAPTDTRGCPNSRHGRSISTTSVKAMIKSAFKNPLHYRKLQELPFPSPFEVNSAQELHWFEDQTDRMDFSVSPKTVRSLQEASPPSRPSKSRSMIKTALSKPKRSLSKIVSGVKKAKDQLSAASVKLGDVRRTLKRSLSQGFGGENGEEEEYDVWMVANPVFGYDDTDVGLEQQGEEPCRQRRTKSEGGDGVDDLARRFEPETPCTAGWQWSAAETGFGMLDCGCPCGENEREERVDGFDALARRFQKNYSCPEGFRFPSVSFWGAGGSDDPDLITDSIGIDYCGDGEGEHHRRSPLWLEEGDLVVEMFQESDIKA